MAYVLGSCRPAPPRPPPQPMPRNQTPLPLHFILAFWQDFVNCYFLLLFVTLISFLRRVHGGRTTLTMRLKPFLDGFVVRPNAREPFLSTKIYIYETLITLSFGSVFLPVLIMGSWNSEAPQEDFRREIYGFIRWCNFNMLFLGLN